jgi:glycine/D-amino acid oxidase-like deaminating enzyme
LKARDARTDAKTSRLKSKLGRLLPQVDAPAEFSRTERFGASASGSPTIGEIPGFRHCYAALGNGGNGITFSMLAASLLTNAIRGRRDPDAHLFAFK